MTNIPTTDPTIVAVLLINGVSSDFGVLFANSVAGNVVAFEIGAVDGIRLHEGKL